jgi:hypothetical protein
LCGWCCDGKNSFGYVFNSSGRNGESNIKSSLSLSFGDEGSNKFVAAFREIEEILVESKSKGCGDISLENLDIDLKSFVDGEGNKIDDANLGNDFLVGFNLFETDSGHG